MATGPTTRYGCLSATMWWGFGKKDLFSNGESSWKRPGIMEDPICSCCNDDTGKIGHCGGCRPPWAARTVIHIVILRSTFLMVPKRECNSPVPQASLPTCTEKMALDQQCQGPVRRGEPNVSQTVLDKDEKKKLSCGALIRIGQIE